jgi:hypothetical protein
MVPAVNSSAGNSRRATYECRDKANAPGGMTEWCLWARTRTERPQRQADRQVLWPNLPLQRLMDGLRSRELRLRLHQQALAHSLPYRQPAMRGMAP